MGRVVLSWEELSNRVAELRAEGNVIVTTNGVFDVLHVGHARYLQAARALGDVLVVGVNSDASTRRIKGDSRPFVSQEERAELLAALGCVDLVTLFDESDPSALLERLRPDIHVKGGDYNVAKMPETPIIERYGGRVVTVPFVAGRSTTGLAERMAASVSR